jgi:hypothetical protein
MLENTLDHWDRLRLHYVSDVLQQRIPEAQAEHRRMIEAFSDATLTRSRRCCAPTTSVRWLPMSS